MRKIFLTITDQERDALVKLALQEERDTRRQAAILLRDGLKRLGLLDEEPKVPGSVERGDQIIHVHRLQEPK